MHCVHYLRDITLLHFCVHLTCVSGPIIMKKVYILGDLNADLKKENTKSARIIRKMEKFMSNPTVVSENKFMIMLLQ